MRRRSCGGCDDRDFDDGDDAVLDDSGFKGEGQVSATSALQCSAQVREYALHSGGKRLPGRGNQAEPATSTRGI